MLDYFKNFQPGKRPPEWWEYECPVPRNLDIRECLQLFRLGELEGVELMKVEAAWTLAEHRAVSGVPYIRSKEGLTGPPERVRADQFLRGAIAYHAHRRFAGVPDELILPLHPVPEDMPKLRPFEY
jgi:hypothetical protein